MSSLLFLHLSKSHQNSFLFLLSAEIALSSRGVVLKQYKHSVWILFRNWNGNSCSYFLSPFLLLFEISTQWVFDVFVSFPSLIPSTQLKVSSRKRNGTKVIWAWWCLLIIPGVESRGPEAQGPSLAKWWRTKKQVGQEFSTPAKLYTPCVSCNMIPTSNWRVWALSENWGELSFPSKYQ